MERWQSIHENRVEYNLSESGVHPLTVSELLKLAGPEAPGELNDLSLGYGQSNGTEALRAAIAALYPGATTANVVVTNGGAEANFTALWRLIQPGDEVVIVSPAYMQAHGLADGFGARVREVWLREEAGWQPDPAEIADAVNERTGLVVVTNPNNPTGAVLGDVAREALIDAADRAGAWLLADEVYAGAELDGRRTPSFFGAHPRVVATGSLSKAYGLPGLRVGWTVAPETMAAELWSRTDYTTIAPGRLTDHLAALALGPEVRPKLIQRTRGMIHEGLARLTSWLDEAGIFTYRPPDAGAILYAHYDLPIDPDELAERLRAEQSVLIVPGTQFAMDRYIRFGYGLLPAELEPALERMTNALAEFAGA